MSQRWHKASGTKIFVNSTEYIEDMQVDGRNIFNTLNPHHIWWHKTENNTDEKCWSYDEKL